LSTPLTELLRPQRLTEVADIGANPTDENPPYKPMLDIGLCRVTGFEPNEEAFARLTTRSNERYLPFVVGDGDPHKLNIYCGSTMTSLFEVDLETLDLFPEFTAWTRLLKQVDVSTHKLDDIAEIENLDYLKIDVQGSELAVFQCGKSKLADTVVIQTEVSFIPLYKQQSPFGEIDIELRGQGFIPHCFANVKRWPISPHVFETDIWATSNQLLEADIVYVRDFVHPETMTDEQIKHLALIAHYCYKSFDLTLRCIMLLEQRGILQFGAQQEYRSLIVQATELARNELS
jgi:FkbM family methyltransferase